MKSPIPSRVGVVQDEVESHQMCIWSKLWQILRLMVNHRGTDTNLKKIRTILKMKAPSKLKENQRLIGRIAALSRFVFKSIDHFKPFLTHSWGK